MVQSRQRTADGFEMQFGTNHLGHFALTNLLLPQVTGRVVTLSSATHRSVRGMDFDDLNHEHAYHPRRAYARSKLANLLFTLELQRRLTEVGSPVRAHAAHPGWAATNLQSGTANRPLRAAMMVGNRLVAQESAAGALPTLFAAIQDLPGGSFVGPGGFGGLRGAPGSSGRSAAAKDEAAAARLWTASEQLTGAAIAYRRQDIGV